MAQNVISRFRWRPFGKWPKTGSPSQLFFYGIDFWYRGRSKEQKKLGLRLSLGGCTVTLSGPWTIYCWLSNLWRGILYVLLTCQLIEHNITITIVEHPITSATVLPIQKPVKETEARYNRERAIYDNSYTYHHISDRFTNLFILVQRVVLQSQK